jgi:hypothetical protein
VKLLRPERSEAQSKGDGYQAEPIFGKSNLIFTLAAADGLLKIHPDATGLSAGETVEVMLIHIRPDVRQVVGEPVVLDVGKFCQRRRGLPCLQRAKRMDGMPGRPTCFFGGPAIEQTGVERHARQGRDVFPPKCVICFICELM